MISALFQCGSQQFWFHGIKEIIWFPHGSPGHSRWPCWLVKYRGGFMQKFTPRFGDILLEVKA